MACRIKWWLISLLLLEFSVSPVARAQSASVAELAQRYAEAYVSGDSDTLLDLYLPAWEGCRAPQYNAMLQQALMEIEPAYKRFVSEPFDVKAVAQGTLFEYLPFWGEWRGGRSFNIDDVLYFSEPPSYELNLSFDVQFENDPKRFETFSRHKQLFIKQVHGNWFFVHRCAGLGAETFFARKATIAATKKARNDVSQQLEQLPLSQQCENDQQCASVPIGSIPCGGPSHHVIYSTVVDREVEERLQSLSQRSAELDSKINQLSSRLGACAYNSARVLACEKNVCVATKELVEATPTSETQ